MVWRSFPFECILGGVTLLTRKQIFSPMKAFAVAAGLVACAGKLDVHETAGPKVLFNQNQKYQDRLPAREALALPMPVGAGFPDYSNFENPFSNLNYFMAHMTAETTACPMIPQSDDIHGKWDVDCRAGSLFTESGLFLIKKLMENEQQKKTGEFKEPAGQMDVPLLRFVG